MSSEAVHYRQMNAVLQQAAQHNGGIVYGCIFTAPPMMDSVQEIQSGHTLAFYAMSQQVLYIDAQLYDGMTQQGIPIFTQLDDVYNFKSQVKHSNRRIFEDYCAFQIFNQLDPKLLPYVQIKVPAPPNAPGSHAVDNRLSSHPASLFASSRAATERMSDSPLADPSEIERVPAPAPL